MKRLINILLIILGIFFVWITTSGILKFECLFKTLFGISCPGCGLTRSFRAIFDLDFYSATLYNILGIPLFIIGIITFISLIIDIIKNSDRTIVVFNNIFKKYYVVIIILIVITTIINNINGI